jgi:hypothetical protein
MVIAPRTPLNAIWVISPEENKTAVPLAPQWVYRSQNVSLTRLRVTNGSMPACAKIKVSVNVD